MVMTMVAAEAPAITKPKLTNCAAPANTTADMAMAWATLKPVLIAIEPASKPHGMTATDKGMAAITPCQNSVAVEWGGQAACKDGLRLLMTNFRYQNTTTVPELGGGVLYEIAQTVLKEGAGWL